MLRVLVVVLAAVLAVPLRAQVSVTITPSGGTYTDPQLAVTVDMCSLSSPLTWERVIQLNGNDVTSLFMEVGSAPGCSGYSTRYEGTIELLMGSNTLYSYAYNADDEWGSAGATYTLTAAGTSTALRIAYPDVYRDVGRCVASCFAATAAYSTPTYTSLDVARGVTLLYRSERARPIGLVEIDALDANPSNVTAYVLRLRRPDNSLVTFVGGRDNIYFSPSAGGWTRLAAQFSASGLTSGAYAYTAEVQTVFASGTPVETTIPARVMIVNGGSSPFGAGWDVASLQTAYPQGDGVMVVSGDGSASFFAECSGTCQLTSPGGDFTTFHRLSSGSYERRYPDGSKLVFSSAGRLTATVDRFGYGTTVGWSGSQLVSVTDPTGHAIQFGYDGAGKLSAITIPGQGGASRTSAFTVWGGNLTQVTDPDSRVNLSASYSSGLLASLTDRRGGQWSYTYARDSLLDTLTAPQITASGWPTRPTTVFSAPSRAILSQVSQGVGSVDAKVAAGLDRRASIRNPRGYTTYFAVNRWGSPTQTDYPLGPSSTAQYDTITGQVKQTVSSSGHTVNYTWVGVQLRVVQDVSAGRTITMTYENTYNRPLSISGSTVSQTFTYPDARTITVTTGSHPATTIKLDVYGRDSLITDPGGHQTRYYGLRSGLFNTDSVKSVGRTWYRRDLFGRVTAVVGPDNARDSVTYDVLDRVVASTNGLNQTTSFQFGDYVHLTQVTDANGNQTSYTRNALGWVEQEYRHGSSNPLVTAYDANGNAISTTNRRSQTVSYAYDALDRMTSRTGTGVVPTTWAYQSATPTSEGYVAAVNSESADTLYYNAADRLVRAATGRGPRWYSLAYRYTSSLGLLDSVLATSSQWSGSKVQTFGYSATGALNAVNFGGVTTLNPGTTNEDIATAITYPNGLGVTRASGGLHEPYVNTYSNSTVNTSLGQQSGLDPLGRVTRVTDVDNYTRKYFYDNARRLSRWESWTITGQSCPPSGELTGCTWGDSTFYNGGDLQYDAVGNLLTGVTSLSAQGNRVLGAKGYTFSYDLDGNLASKVGNGLTQTYGFDPLGQLTSVTTNGTTVEYGYDGFGRRVRRNVGADTTRYLLDGDNLAMELNTSGDLVAEYAYWGLDRPHAMRKNGQTYYFALESAAGSVKGLIRESDNVVAAQLQYLPFGEVEIGSDGVGMPFRFAAREYDATTGLQYNRARYYDASIGRFVSEDPIGLSGGVNLYAYAASDPVNQTDPYGLCPKGQSEKISFRKNEDGDWIVEKTCLDDSGNPLGLPSTAVVGRNSPVAGILALGSVLNGIGEFSGMNALGRGADALARSQFVSGGIELALALPVGRSAKAANFARRFTPDQAALVALAKRAKVTGGLNSREAAIMKEWADEYELLFRGPEAHPGRGFGSFPHLHIGPINHIPYRP